MSDDPRHVATLTATLTTALQEAGLEDARLLRQAAGEFEAQGQAWAPVVLKAAGDEPLWIKLPTTASGTLGADGRVQVRLAGFDPEVLEEGRAFVTMLLKQGLLDLGERGAGSKLQRGPRAPTHQVVLDDQGRRRVQRRGFG